MGTFELERDRNAREKSEDLRNVESSGSKEKKEECIISLKVYDHCRQQDCLTPSMLGPARSSECTVIDGNKILEGDIIIPPSDATSVSIDDLRLKKIIILDKEPNPFKPGFWDIQLKYVFKYNLTFYMARNESITVRAISVFIKTVTLFGSIGTDIVISTDLLAGDSDTLDAEPFVLVEGKAIALNAELNYPKCGCSCDCDCERGFYSPVGGTGVNADEVDVTIGLFTIIKLFRLVNLLVDSKGFCVPDECEEIAPNPCEFFDNLDFPLDIFSPPQKDEFFAGVSSFDPRKKHSYSRR